MKKPSHWFKMNIMIITTPNTRRVDETSFTEAETTEATSTL